MTAREAWLITLMMVVVLGLGLAAAGIVSEWLAPEVQTQIGEAWSLGPR